MATADQVKALVRSYAQRDDDSFFAVAMQVAAREAKVGHSQTAQDIRDLVDRAKIMAKQPVRQLRALPVTQPSGELAGLLAASSPDQHLGDLVVDTTVHASLERVLIEQRERDRLVEHGFEPVRTLLLTGPPGTGKTLSASVIASELRLPLFLIRFDSLMTSYMGATAAKLRLIFDAVEATQGVYFFDEVDALAGDRSAANDIGEIRRVLNSFLQFLEQHHSTSIIIAATNHPQLLDPAIFRRFGLVVEYAMPTPDQTQLLIRNRLATFSTRELRWEHIEAAAKELSHSEVLIATEQAAKEAILAGAEHVTTEMLVSALTERQRSTIH